MHAHAQLLLPGSAAWACGRSFVGIEAVALLFVPCPFSEDLAYCHLTQEAMDWCHGACRFFTAMLHTLALAPALALVDSSLASNFTIMLDGFASRLAFGGMPPRSTRRSRPASGHTVAAGSGTL